jgi:hypothetical protein
MRPRRNTGESNHRPLRRATTGLAAICAAVLSISCAATRPHPDGTSSCAVLDSLLASSRLGEPVAIAGHATVDADQFRMKGKILLEALDGGIVFEFTSTLLFGQQREDFVFSLSGDTLRIVDRERGAYYEGVDAEAFLAEALGADFDVPEALRLAFGGTPLCGELSAIRCVPGALGEVYCEGRRYGKPFKVSFEGRGGRIESVEWPVLSDRYGGDRLRVEYEWDDGEDLQRLVGVVLSLEARGWRCKIRASEPG